MYETLSFLGAPMDTDGRSTSAWFNVAGPSYFPAFKTCETAFASKTSDVLAGSYPAFNSGVNNSVSAASNSFNRPAPIYKMYLREMMRGRGSSKARFKTTVGVEPIGSSNYIKYQYLTAMREYLNKSFEEIRLEDYIASSVHEFENYVNTQVPEPSLTKPTEEPALLKPVVVSAPPVLDTILQNVADIMNRRNVTEENPNDNTSSAAVPDDEAMFNLLQTLLNNVKQRLDVNCLSEKAKRNCAKLIQALAEFTEKTLENLTVIVLEDMLNNIRSRSTIVHDTDTGSADKYTSTCSCLGKDSRQEKETEFVEDRNISKTEFVEDRNISKTEFVEDRNISKTEFVEDRNRSKTEFLENRNRSKKKSYSNKRDDEKVIPPYHGGYSSAGEDSAERGESMCNETEHRCALTPGAGKGGRRKALSVPTTFSKTKSWFTRSARHSYCGTSKSAEKINRYRGHRKLSDEKYNFREKTYDDSDVDELLNRTHELKYGHRDDGWVTITKAKHNRESYRNKKKSPKKIQFSTQAEDECRVCDSFKNVSLDDMKPEKTRFPRSKERLYEAETEYVEGNEDKRGRADKSTNASSAHADESGAARNEFDELQSYSDTSSV